MDSTCRWCGRRIRHVSEWDGWYHLRFRPTTLTHQCQDGGTYAEPIDPAFKFSPL